ncbi:acyl-CoA reductase [Longispora sp. K20-0274]|uniref:acyl-CoA reductase n=1 Tax=Longispora sp. K20-0274 TaxID=3088255 RepID=UPI00399A9BA5
MVDFLVAFAKRLLKPAVARRHPELASLGFFLRRGPLADALAPLDGLRFPRGLVFHIPPANVDTIFVYSWALSALCGNANIVRISERAAGAATVVLDALTETLADADPVVGRTQSMISYGRDDAVTARLSAACDLRVIWGGDASVAAIRKFPLAPHARDLTFPDRSSFTVVSVPGWERASAAERRAAAEGLYNDAYWFDQAACASPRTVFWVGGSDGAAVDSGAARREFWGLVREVVAARHPDIDAAMAIEKRVATYGLALEGQATALHYTGNAVATVDLRTPADLPRRWLGTGVFPEADVATLADLVPLVQRRDQTVTHFGLTAAELLDFARALAGRGVDRFVPLGEALSFAATWDGYHLPHEFTRQVTIKTL